jgi:hypothetical protein
VQDMPRPRTRDRATRRRLPPPAPGRPVMTDAPDPLRTWIAAAQLRSLPAAVPGNADRARAGDRGGRTFDLVLRRRLPCIPDGPS